MVQIFGANFRCYFMVQIYGAKFIVLRLSSKLVKYRRDKVNTTTMWLTCLDHILVKQYAIIKNYPEFTFRASIQTISNDPVLIPSLKIAKIYSSFCEEATCIFRCIFVIAKCNASHQKHVYDNPCEKYRIKVLNL